MTSRTLTAEGVDGDRFTLVLLSLITLLGFYLRLLNLEFSDVWWDEVVTATRALLPLDELWTGLRYQGPSVINCDCSPPLHHFFIHFSLLLGKSEFFLKLPNVLFGTLTIPLVYLLGKRLLGRRCGLLAALYLALNLFHWQYSRDARWYALFYFLAVAGFYFFMCAVEEGKFWQWAAYALASAGMLYTSYTAVTYIVAQPLALCLLFAWGRWRRSGPSLRSALRGCGLALFAAGVLYAPWIPGQRNAFLFFYDGGFSRPFDTGELLHTMSLFVAPPFERPFDYGLLVLVLVSLGLTAFAVSRRYFAVLALVLWTAIPVASAYKASIGVGLSPRYVMSLLFFLVIMAGAVGSLPSSLAARLRPGVAWVRGLALVLGLGFVLAASVPNFIYDTYSRGGRMSHRPVMSYLARHREGIDALLFDRNRNHKAMSDWYLHDIYPGADSLTGRDYKRCYLMSYRSQDTPTPENLMYFHGDMSVQMVGFVNRSPLLVEPDKTGAYVFQDNFGGLDVYSNAEAIDNLAPDMNSCKLALYEPGRDGTVTYALKNLSGRALASFRTHFFLDLDRIAGIEPDSVVTVTAESEDGRSEVLCRFDATHFPSTTGNHSMEVPLDIPTSLMEGNILRVRFSIGHGQRNGEFKLSGIRFEVQLEDGPPLGIDGARGYVEHIQANTTLTQFVPGVEPVMGKVLYCFATESADSGGLVGSPEDMARFLADHPGVRPVYRLADPSGKERFVFYDPFLGEPYLWLSPDRTRLVSVSGPPRKLSGIALKGQLVAPTLELFGERLLLPIRTPHGTEVFLNPGGDGLITLEARLGGDDFDARQFESFDNIRKLPKSDTLTCSTPEGPCFATYRLESHYPMTQLRFVWYPACFGGAGASTFVRLTVSLDGGPPQLVDHLSGDGLDHWQVPESRAVVLSLPRPATSALVRIEISGDAANVSTPGGLPFIFEAKLDARAMPAPVTNPHPTRLGVQGDRNNDFGIVLLDLPFRYNSRLDRQR